MVRHPDHLSLSGMGSEGNPWTPSCNYVGSAGDAFGNSGIRRYAKAVKGSEYISMKPWSRVVYQAYLGPLPWE